MRFHQLFAQRTRPVISFEVFPPKTEEAMDGFRRVLPRLVELRPDFMTVTYGALGSTQARTLEIAALIRRDFALEAACHLTCVGSTAEGIEVILRRIRDSGIDNVVALRGDPPQGERHFQPPEGGYRHACELVAHIRSRHPLGIAVAGYPEKHLEAPDVETDLRHLRDKVSRGADIVITQLFYDNRHYRRFVERARALGIGVPIVPGLLPIVGLQQVKRITSMCGSTIPLDLLASLEARSGDEGAALEVGVRHAAAQARELLQGGAPGIHFYVLNRSQHMQRIMAEVRPLQDGPGGGARP
ncbi:MAG: methylenetetrahydrofolate reductase [NAD(P)H] [Thermoanaerobaculia bacterium]